CQEVMKALPAGVKRYQKDGQPESFRRWLSRIVQRKIIDFHRRSWKQPRGVGGTEHLGRIHRAVDEAGRPDDSCLPRDIPAARLTKVLECVEQKVSAATWKAFWMMTVNDYTSTEVSALLDISPNAVRLARARVLQALRATLERGDDSFGVMSPSTI
ncbi:MAG: RNA polymerase sigma factor, partial [Planctomycetaceae bacterium]